MISLHLYMDGLVKGKLSYEPFGRPRGLLKPGTRVNFKLKDNAQLNIMLTMHWHRLLFCMWAAAGHVHGEEGRMPAYDAHVQCSKDKFFFVASAC